MSANKRGHRRHSSRGWDRPELLVSEEDLHTAFPDVRPPQRRPPRRSRRARQEPARRKPLSEHSETVLAWLRANPPAEPIPARVIAKAAGVDAVKTTGSLYTLSRHELVIRHPSGGWTLA